MAFTVHDLLDCSQMARGTLERVNYFPRQLITVDDMVAERDYFLARMRRHNRLLHGWGVVCGLDVTVPQASQGAVVQIGSGYALGPYGDEIYVPEPISFDLAKCGPGASTDPCEPTAVSGPPGIRGIVYLVIKYAECLARPVRALPAGCACDDDCEYSRIRDSFQIGCLEQPPASPPLPSLCDIHRGSAVVPCPPDPIDPWVLLAKVTVPAAGRAARKWNMKITIDTSVRRILVSSAILQEQLIECCCDGQIVRYPIPPVPVPVPPVRPTRAPVTVAITIVPGNAKKYALQSPPRRIVFEFSKPLKSDVSQNAAIQITGPSGRSVRGTLAFVVGTAKATFTPDQGAFGRGGSFDITVSAKKVTATDDSMLDSDATRQFQVTPE